MKTSEPKLNNLLGRFVTGLGAAMHAGNAVIGDRLGLYRGLWELGPATPERLAAHTGLIPRVDHALDGVAGKLAAGGRIADVGCGLGTSARVPVRSATRPAKRPPARSPNRAGFTRFRRAAQTPFNLVFEIRP